MQIAQRVELGGTKTYVMRNNKYNFILLVQLVLCTNNLIFSLKLMLMQVHVNKAIFSKLGKEGCADKYHKIGSTLIM